MGTVANSPDPAFPRFHARPARGWISHPSGLSYADGRFHVFFQFNPDSARRSGIHRGHLSSADLVSWTEEPVTLTPPPGPPDPCGGWAGVAEGMPQDPLVTAARDSSTSRFQFQGRRYALQGAGLETGRAAVLLYSADQPGTWRYEGIWFSSDEPLAATHLPAEIWEGPQLVRVPDSSGAETWLLMASLGHAGDTGQHPGGVGYLLGSIAAGTAGLPVFVPETGGRADLGRAFYAPQILALPPRTLLWGWSPEAAPSDDRRGRSQEDIEDAGWAGILTFPRQLSVHGGALAEEPAAELHAYRGTQLYAGAAGTLALPRYAEAHVTGGEGRIRLALRSALTRRTVFTENVAGGDEFRIFVDASIVEAYRHGSVPTTVRVYPEAGEAWQLELPHGASADAWELHHPDPPGHPVK